MARSKGHDNALPPVLTAAIFCDDVTFEGDIPSVKRIVDIVNVPEKDIPKKKGEPLTLSNVRMLLILKSGLARGERKVRIAVNTPAGTTEDVASFTLNFGGPEVGGHQLRADSLALIWQGPGTYWYEISVGNKLLGRTPFWVDIDKAPPAKPS